jgi:energy-converting hydrogenase Eha subunit C
MSRVLRATCGNCGEQFLDSENERKPCPVCQSTGPRTREVVLSAGVQLKGALGAIVHRKPVRKRHVVGYVVTGLLAAIGFVAGLLVHSLAAAAIVTIVILILGVAANEVWGLEVHQHHEHFPDL